MSNTVKIILVIAAIAVLYWWYTNRQKNETVVSTAPQSTTKSAAFGGGGFGGGAVYAPAPDTLASAVANAPAAAESPYQGLFNGTYATNQMLPALQLMANTPSTVIQGPATINSTGLSYHTAPQAPVVSIGSATTAKTVKAGAAVSYNAPALV